MMNDVIIPESERMKGLLSSKVSVSGVWAGPGVVTQATIGGVEFPDFTPDIRVYTRTAADTAARSPPVCAAAIPNNRPRGPALNLTPAKNWPRRNYASHILYDNIMRTRRPLDP